MTVEVRCRGTCKGDRAAWESPAVIHKGRPACPCCGIYLQRTPYPETQRAPNLNRAIEDNSIRFEDNVCKYDVVLLPSVKERQA